MLESRHLSLSRRFSTFIVASLLIGCGPGEMSDPTPVDQQDPSMQFQDPSAGKSESGGKSTTSGCGACAGCCLGNSCIPGNADQACGLGGLQCRQCGSGERCEGNTCRPSPPPPTTPDPDPKPEPKPEPEACGPDNCNGCCGADGKCNKAPAFPLCGADGYKCKTCDDDQLCSLGVCTDKPPVIYDVVVVSAKIDGDCEGPVLSWINDCDPVVQITFNGQKYETKSDDGDDTPDWNETLFSATDDELTAEFLQVEVVDEDSLLTFSDDKIGKCTIDVTDEILAAGEVVVDCGDAKDLKISFVPKD